MIRASGGISKRARIAFAAPGKGPRGGPERDHGRLAEMGREPLPHPLDAPGRVHDHRGRPLEDPPVEVVTPPDAGLRHSPLGRFEGGQRVQGLLSPRPEVGLELPPDVARRRPPRCWRAYQKWKSPRPKSCSVTIPGWRSRVSYMYPW